MWRLRNLLQLITVYFLWLSIIPNKQNFLGYSQQTMLTYVLATSIISAVVFSSLIGQVGDEINTGNLSNFLLRPINYFFYWFSKDTGDKIMNLFFSIIELIVIVIFLHPPLFFQTNLLFILLAILGILEAILMHFFINFLLGFIAFWSSEVWAPRFLFFTVYSFFSGGLFPLDILPKPLFTIFSFLPFTYLQYFPIKIYLGEISISQIFAGFLIALIWLFGLLFLTKYAWKKGLIEYSAQGR